MPEPEIKNVFITGGAGFVGSVFVRRLLALNTIGTVTIFDRNAENNEISRVKIHDERLVKIVGDLKDADLLCRSMTGSDTVFHLASNADIAAASKNPSIDFVEGTALTQNTLEAARICGVKTFVYSSGSGVYGDCGKTELKEDAGPFKPISTYGASKLAGEALLCAYCHMFEMRGLAFRFANIVGGAQTHGVTKDFVEKLKNNANELMILGDGLQSKSYLDVDDAFDAVWLACSQANEKFEIYNVASTDQITVKEIAAIAIEQVLGKNAPVELKFTGGERGWKGDVPVVRLNADKIRALGFVPKLTSREAIHKAIRGIIETADSPKPTQETSGAQRQ